MSLLLLLKASGGSTQSGDASLTATATIGAGAAITASIDATLTGTAAIATAGAVTGSSDAAVTATATVSAAAAAVLPSGATLAATGTVSTAGATTAVVGAALTGAAAVTADAAGSGAVSASITATATVTATGTASTAAGATLTGVATVTAGDVATVLSPAAVTGTATITAAGVPTYPSTGAVAATATITADGTPARPSSAAFTGTAAITAAATGTYLSGAALTGTATVSLGATAVRATTASLTGTATITATASGPVSWKTRLTAAQTSTATWMAIGDSITEGYNLGSRAQRWIELLHTHFRSYAGVTGGGRGFVPCEYLTGWSDGIATVGGAESNTTGFGYRGRTISAAGSVAWTATGTIMDVWYRRTSGGGTFTWKVDAGGTTTVDTNGASSWQRVTISLGASGSHTVTAARLSGTVTLGGAMVYDGDTAAGVQLYDAAATSIDSSQYTGQSAFEAGTPDYTALKGALATVAPDLVTIYLGANDSINGTPSPSACAANLTTLITDLQALAKPPDILLIAGYSMVSASSWSTYVSQMSSVATARGVGFLNLNSAMPAADTSGTGFYQTDGVHPNSSGNTQIAHLVASALNVPFGSVTADAALSATATITATGTVVHPAAAAVTGTATVTAAGTAERLSGAALTATATIGGAAVAERVAGAALAGTATIAAAAAAGPAWGPPTGFTVTPISDTQIDLSWNARTGASGYDIERDGVVIAMDVVGTAYSDTGLSPNSTHTYRARSVRA